MLRSCWCRTTSFWWHRIALYVVEYILALLSTYLFLQLEHLEPVFQGSLFLQWMLLGALAASGVGRGEPLVIVSLGAYRPNAQMVIPPCWQGSGSSGQIISGGHSCWWPPHCCSWFSSLRPGLACPLAVRCAATHSSPPGGLAQPTTQLLTLERYFSNTAMLRLKFVLIQHHECLGVCMAIIKLATIKCSHIP